MTLVDTSALIAYPGNARLHALDVIADSLRANEQYRPIVVQTSTGYVLAGNGTLAAARDKLGWAQIEADYIDVDDSTARRINLADNRAADRATYDNKVLLDLLGPLAAAGDLAGSGFDLDAVDDLRNLLEDTPVIDPGAFSGDYGETDEEHDARKGKGDPKPDAQDDSAAPRAKPILLVLPGSVHDAFTKLLLAVRQPDEPQAMTVLRALRAAT